MSSEDDFEKMIKEMIKRIMKDFNLNRIFRDLGLPEPDEKEIDDIAKIMSRIRFYGFTITMGPDGKPVIKEIKPENLSFNINNMFTAETDSTREEEGKQEPFIDFIEVGNGLKIIVETDDPDRVSVEIDDNSKVIAVSIGGFREEYTVSKPLDPESMNKRYKNGILEIELHYKE